MLRSREAAGLAVLSSDAYNSPGGEEQSGQRQPRQLCLTAAGLAECPERKRLPRGRSAVRAETAAPVPLASTPLMGVRLARSGGLVASQFRHILIGSLVVWGALRMGGGGVASRVLLVVWLLVYIRFFFYVSVCWSVCVRRSRSLAGRR